jgi:hypothetical protein
VIFEGEGVGRARVFDGSESDAFVEARCAFVFCAEAYVAKALSGFFYKGGDKGSTYSLVAPCGADVDAADAAGMRFGGEGVDGEPADGDELAVVEVPAEDFTGGFEAIGSAGPLVDEGVNEVVAVFFCFSV